MYFEETRSEKKNPLHFAIALVAALMINGAMGAAIIHGGIDNRLARETSNTTLEVANLGTLPVLNVTACRTKA